MSDWNFNCDEAPEGRLLLVFTANHDITISDGVGDMWFDRLNDGMEIDVLAWMPLEFPDDPIITPEIEVLIQKRLVEIEENRDE